MTVKLKAYDDATGKSRVITAAQAVALLGVGGVVDDPVVKTANFNADRNVRYTLSASFSFTAFLPSVGLVNGDFVEFIGTGVSPTGQVIIDGNGNTLFASPISNLGGPYATMNYKVKELALAFRWDGANWYSLGGSITSYLATVLTNTVLLTDSAGSMQAIGLNNGDSALGRVENGEIQELRPWSVLHNLFKESSGVNRVVDSTSSGAVVLWQGNATLTNWLRCLNVRWQGPGAFVNLVVRGMAVTAASAEFSPMKLISNFALGRGNLILKGNDPLAAVGTRIITPSRDYSANYTDYILSWGEHVWVRYMEGNWHVLAPIRDGGATVDHRLTTTDAVANLIHDYPTEDNDRVIAYKVRVEALHATSGDSAFFDIAALFYRNGAGVITQKDVAFLNGPFKDAGAVAWDVTFTIATTHIEMRVTGDAGDTIRWRVTGSITENL